MAQLKLDFAQIHGWKPVLPVFVFIAAGFGEVLFPPPRRTWRAIGSPARFQPQAVPPYGPRHLDQFALNLASGQSGNVHGSGVDRLLAGQLNTRRRTFWVRGSRPMNRADLKYSTQSQRYVPMSGRWLVPSTGASLPDWLAASRLR